jgi:hypothetical protein
MHMNGRNACVFAAAIATLASGAASAASTDNWPMYQANPQHNGYIAQTLIPANAQFEWAIQGQAAAPSGLAVYNGVILTTPQTYFGGHAPLVAQSLAAGDILWSQDFGSLFSVNQPAVADGVIYLQTSNNYEATYLHCYLIDGTFMWRAPFASQWEHYLGPIIVNGKVYFDGGSYGGIYSFSDQDGEMNWFAGLPQYDSWSPTWANGQLVVYTDQLDVVAPDSGLVLETITDPTYYWSGYSPNQSPVVIGNLAYVTNGGRLMAYDMLNQNIAWAVSISASGQVATDGTQLFVVAGGALSVRNPANGALLWSWVPTATGSVTTRLIVTDSHVIAGDGTQTYIVNRSTHHTDGTFDSSGLMAYAGDRLVIADQNGKVHAYFLPSDEMFGNGFE